MHRAFQAMMAGFALTSLCLIAAAVDARSQTGSGADRAQINKLLADWEDAWNTHDMAAFASHFTKTENGYSGPATSGREGA